MKKQILLVSLVVNMLLLFAIFHKMNNNYDNRYALENKLDVPIDSFYIDNINFDKQQNQYIVNVNVGLHEDIQNYIGYEIFNEEYKLMFNLYAMNEYSLYTSDTVEWNINKTIKSLAFYLDSKTLTADECATLDLIVLNKAKKEGKLGKVSIISSKTNSNLIELETYYYLETERSGN